MPFIFVDFVHSVLFALFPKVLLEDFDLVLFLNSRRKKLPWHFFYLVSCRLNGYSYYQDADQRADVSKAENEETLAKLSQSEKAQTEWKGRVSKLEEDNARLRRAVEQSMTRLNRMSVDSDYLVDRLTCLCS